jgi:hypothetical protein
MDWLRQLIGDRKVSLVATLDHVELTPTHLVMGLKLDWHNGTNDPIPIKEVLVRVYLGGRGVEPLRFYPLERFERVFARRGLQKTPVAPFRLPPRETYTEQIRFISQEVLDISPGNYAVDVQLTDADNISYTSRIKIGVESTVKYRRSEEWQEED